MVEFRGDKEDQVADGKVPSGGVPDMTKLSVLNEDVINKNLKIRYENNRIYTYAGSILVAVNPYQKIDIYNQKYVCHYRGNKLGTLEPHVFALTEAAYTSLQSDTAVDDTANSSNNQSVVISGESGAGKTENTRFMLQYLCSISGGISTWIEQQILEANTILEAFGNAKTVRNDNSSRFGKFMQVCFDQKWTIAGCIVQDYLLEQSRIIHQSPEEQNYHVFYQLIEEAKVNAEFAGQLHLANAPKFNYLNYASDLLPQSKNDDDQNFDSLRLAFNVLQVPAVMCNGIFQTLSAILWLGNLTFEDVEDGERCKLTQNDAKIIATISSLLNIDVDALAQVVLIRQINVRGNITEIPLKLQEARENRHAMAKALYSRCFAWLINHINNCVNPGQDSKRFLGFLDIFGFENFTVNSFEQLCINYTNEKLHKFFNHYVFAIEQEIYQQENIRYDHITFVDNTACLELLEKPPRCVLKLLSEQCHMPCGCDASYISNLHGEFAANEHYVKGEDKRRWETEFGIKHYAGLVLYNVHGFVDKNRDVQQDVFFDIISRSENEFVQDLTRYQTLKIPNGSTLLSGTISRSGTGKGKLTVSDTFRHQLQSLVDVLQSTKSWYVRCIKPNSEKNPNHYDNNMVMVQLKYLGMLDIIRMRKQGYPYHCDFEEFVTRYYYVVGGRHRTLSKDNEQATKQILDFTGQTISSDWQLGRTKVFMRSHVRDQLEEVRTIIITSSVIRIQTNFRRFDRRRKFLQLRNATVRIQCAYRGWRLRIRFLRMRRAAIVVQKHLRAMFAREVVTAMREMQRIEAIRELERIECAAETEIAALAEIAVQLETSTRSISDQQTSRTSAVDLDSLFAFLSEVRTENVADNMPQSIEEISECMRELIVDLDEELETVIQKELEDLARDQQQRAPPPPIVQNTSSEPIYDSVAPVSPPPLPTPPRSRPSSVGPPSAHHRRAVDGPREQRRRHRVDKKLQELTSTTEPPPMVLQPPPPPPPELILHNGDGPPPSLPPPPCDEFDIMEFVEKCFNAHERSPEGTIMATLTRKKHSTAITIPKEEMVTYYRGNSIPNSHIYMYDPDSSHIACTIFRDLCKYIRGELNAERELTVIQTIIGHCLEREEMRDEVLVQCVRQATKNPNHESTERVWLFLCLCVVSFQPSKQFHRYFVTFLRKNLTHQGRVPQYVQWCLDNCHNNKVTVRQLPPSSIEVDAMKRLGTIVCRFSILDGQTKAIDVHPTDTAGDAARKLAQRLGLRNLDGWAIYQCIGEVQEHVRSHHYLYDVIAQWEVNRQKVAPSSGGFSTLGRRSAATLNSVENRLIFKRRLFRNVRQLSQDPIEVNLLYAQAVHSVVKSDDFPVTEKVAIQLAGLQAQVALGNPNDNLEHYNNFDNYLPYRISRTRGDDVWISIIAQAHRQYGSNRNELAAKALYLSCVMQYPLYGTTMFPVTYRGYWSYGNSIVLGVKANGLLLIKPDDKFVLNEYSFDEIEHILLDPSDSFITVTLLRRPTDNTSKCFVFETDQKDEIGSLIASYWPPLAGCLLPDQSEVVRTRTTPTIATTSEDRLRLYHNLVKCRQQLVDEQLVRRPVGNTGGFLRNTLRRLSKRHLDKLRQECGGDSGETYKGFYYAFWAFSRQQMAQSISRLDDADECTMLQMFQTILTYAGLGQNGETIKRAEDEHIVLLQTILEQCMGREHLVCELYLQLIKQTTDHPDPNSRVNLRHWALLSLACSIMLPTNKTVCRYVIAHLKRCSSDFVTEEGKYARFAEKCRQKTQNTRPRQWCPSREEILCTINRRAVYARFYFMDGRYHSVEFAPSACAKDVLALVQAKIGLNVDTKGYALYEVLGGADRSLDGAEKVTDVMAKWEKYRKSLSAAAPGAAGTNGTPDLATALKLMGGGKRLRPQQHFFLFKRHLFLDDYMNLRDPVEKQLRYHQVLHDLRTDKFPVSDTEAMMLTGLQAQLELGDVSEKGIGDYSLIAAHCLPQRLIPNLSHDGIACHHQSLRGMTAVETQQAFLNVIQSWPLHRATIFDVMQSFTSNWPRVLWLAVDQNGLHLLVHRSRSVLCTYEYGTILSYAPAVNCLMIITGSDRKQSKVILTTAQAFQIATLIKEYMEVLYNKTIPTFLAPSITPKSNLSGGRQPQHYQMTVVPSQFRPHMSLHPTAPLVPPQPS